MKKQIFALFCALVLLLGAVPSAGALTGESARAADTLATLGLVQGTTSGDYALDAPATRAQATVLLVWLAGGEGAAKADPWFAGFRDLPAWAADSIDYAAHQGWVTGVTVLDFKPSDTITANGWCAFLLRMLGYSDKAGDFAVEDAAAFAQRVGLISTAYDGPLTRGDLFEMARDALTFSYKDGNGTIISRLADSGAVSRSAANALGLLTPELTARQAADRHMVAVFRLDCYEKPIEIDAGEPSANASGFFISADGLAITNYHAIEGRAYATIRLITGERYDVEKVLFYDPGMDIAVLQISKISTLGDGTTAFAYLPLQTSDTVRNGDIVYAIGSPLGMQNSVTSGVVSSCSRSVEAFTVPVIQNTASISIGSSGGALFNEYGEVIGITSAYLTYGNNMYLAVPMDGVLTADLTGPGKTLEQVKNIEKAKADKD